MGDEARAFKDEATEELEQFLMQQVQAAMRSELGPIVDDLSDDVRRAVQEVRTDLDRCDKESKDSLRKLEARLIGKIESVQDRIGSQISERLDEDRTFLKESFALLSTGEEVQQLLESQSDTRSTVLKGVKHVSVRMATNGESQAAELKLISEASKKLQLLVGIALAVAGLAAATSAAVLLLNLLG
jgi:hypothetical protein